MDEAGIAYVVLHHDPCFELAHLIKKMKKKKESKIFWQSGNFLVQYFCDAFFVLRHFLVLLYIAYRVYHDSQIQCN